MGDELEISNEDALESDGDSNPDEDDINNDLEMNEEYAGAENVQRNDVPIIVPEGERGENVENEYEEIYPGAQLSKEESRLLVMSFVVRHNLTDVALEDLLDLLNCHSPRMLYTSKHSFLKDFPAVSKSQLHYYCQSCFVLLNMNNRFGATCPSCDNQYNLESQRRNGHYFTYIPIKEQLKSKLSGPIYHQLRRNNNEDELSDVTSGRVYKTLRENGTISNTDITLQWNADGVQTFKSSKVSMCPVQVTINELPYRLRKENVMLAGLWAATQKPVISLFMKPFVEELTALHNDGFECTPPDSLEPETVKAHTILAPVDSVERCSLQNVHQYNGKFGCSFCFNEGVRIPMGNGHARVYTGGTVRRRTEAEHTEHALQAQANNTNNPNNADNTVFGVKGVSIFMLLPIFNIIYSFPPEYMHCALLGVVKLFLSNWVDAKNHLEQWYIGTKIRTLDKKLLRIRPPCEVSRTPRSINDLKLWKASEFKNFLLYYSLVCLKGILAPQFLKHWLLLAYSITIFNGDKIGRQERLKATEALTKFVSDTERLYGAQFMKFNVHLLLHVPRCVENFGALWAWSAFPYEGYNSVLRSMLHNSQSIVHQICKSYQRYQNIKHDETFSKPNHSVPGEILFLKMIGNYRKKTGNKPPGNDELVVYGNAKDVTLNIGERIQIQALIEEPISDLALSYDRFVFQKILYHSSSSTKLTKRINSVVETTQNTFVNISHFLRVQTANNVNIFVVVGKSLREKRNTFTFNNGNVSSLSIAQPVTVVDDIVAYFPHQIRKKCVFVEDENDEQYVVKLSNVQETD